jgi:glucose-1-phosphate adenylyltransferase
VFCNLENLRAHAPRLLLVLAGDHVYQMDYRPMIETHLRTRAAATIACMEVPLAEASRYGVLGTDASLRIDSFAEKPAKPVPTVHCADRAMISMGVYLFDFETIARELQADALTEGSSHDFGHDVIPRLIHAHRVQAYRFHDAAGGPCFWRDVGTLDVYYETNMALLDSQPGFDPESAAWPIYSGSARTEPVRFRAGPARTSGAAQANDDHGAPVTLEGMAIRSDLGAGCRIAGGIVNHSVLAEGVHVDSGALVQNCVVLPEARIGARSSLRNAIIAAGCQVPPGTRIGIEGSEDTLPCELTAGGIRIVTQEAVDRWLGRQSAGAEAAQEPGRRVAAAG